MCSQGWTYVRPSERLRRLSKTQTHSAPVPSCTPTLRQHILTITVRHWLLRASYSAKAYGLVACSSFTWESLDGFSRSACPFSVALGRCYTPCPTYRVDTIHIWTEWPNGDKFPFGPAYQPFGRFAITTLTHLRHPVHSHLLGPSLFSANSLCPFLPCTPTFDHQSPAVGSCISLPLGGQGSHLHGHAVVKVQRSKTASFPLILPDALCERRFRANGSHPDDAGDIDLAIQVLVALVVVQAVLECLANRDHHKYCSTYVLIEQTEQHTHHVAPYIPNLKDWALRGFL